MRWQGNLLAAGSRFIAKTKKVQKKYFPGDLKETMQRIQVTVLRNNTRILPWKSTEIKKKKAYETNNLKVREYVGKKVKCHT